MLPSNVAYRCRRDIVVGGHQLKAGALLPKDSPLRLNRRRMEILYRTRFIEPANVEATQAQVTQEATKDSLLSFTSDELRLLLRGRGLGTKGSDDALRARLRAVLG